MQSNFRVRLRHETRRQHDALDAMISDVNLTSKEGLSIFFTAHLASFQAMREACDPLRTSHELLGEMISSIEADLDVVGQLSRAPKVELPHPIDPLAIDYIVAGSRLGTQVLARTWMRASNETVKSAGRYFKLGHTPHFWQAVCKLLADIPVQGDRAMNITKDTKQLFELFSAALRQSTAQEEPVQ